MAETRTVISFDPSKTSTGYAVAQQRPDGSGIILELGTIKPSESARKSRWFHPLVDDVMHRLMIPFQGYGWFGVGDFTIAVESVVYGESSSELQFYLTQEIMRLAARLRVNVVTFSNGMVKSWAKQWSTRTNWPRFLKKEHMEDIWRNELRPMNRDMFPSSIAMTDDAVDAGWIALLGLYAHAHIVPQWSDPSLTPPYLWVDTEVFRDAFLERRFNHLTNLTAPDLSVVFKNMRTNKHLSMSADSLLPFGVLSRLAAYTREKLVEDPGATQEHLLGRLGRTTNRKALSAALSNGFTFSLDSSGGLLIVPTPGGVNNGIQARAA